LINKVNGYFDFEVIKNYEKLNDKLVINYLDGSSSETFLDRESKIILLMEEQGLKYANEYDNISNYCVNIVSGVSSLILTLVGTLGWIKFKCDSLILDNDQLVLVAFVSSIGVGSEVILIRSLFYKLAFLIGFLNDKKKYNYYFKNKEEFSGYVSINELDNYSLDYLKEMVNDNNYKSSFKKILRRKR